MSSAYNYKAAKNFLGPRLRSIAGYHCPPAISDAMFFFLPAFLVASARAVRIDGRLWELWSPNSKTFAFYPGLRALDLDPEDVLPPHLKRADGHLGRFDPTVSPQHFDPERLWLGFIRREGDYEHPEYTPLLEVWNPTTRPNRGHLTVDYATRLKKRVEAVVERVNTWKVLESIRPDLWANRPSDPASDDLIAFASSMTFDEAVDRLARVQRSIKHLCAWCRLASAIKQDSTSTTEFLRSVPSANDFLMGIWLNGCEENDGLLFLRWRVPCYIIHTIDTSSEMNRISGSYSPILSNFISRTPAAKLVPETYAHDVAILNEKGDLRDVKEDFAIRPSQGVIPCKRTDRLRASPTNQGFKDGQYSDPRYASPSPPLAQTVKENEGRLIPPPVAGVSSGKWSVWQETHDSNGNECMVKVGHGAAKSLGGKIYFDRNNRRRLYFLSHPFVPPNYNANIEVFGLPVPDGQYIERGNNNLETQCSPSKWVYKKEKPDRGTEGTTYSIPSTESRGANVGIEHQIADSSGESEEEEPMDLRSRSSASPLPIEQSRGHRTCSPSLNRLPIDEDLMDTMVSESPNNPSDGFAPSPLQVNMLLEHPFRHQSEGGQTRSEDRSERLPRGRPRSRSPRIGTHPRVQRSYRQSDRHWSPPAGRSSRWSHKVSPPFRSRRQSPSDYRISRRTRSRSPRGRSRLPAMPRRFTPPRTSMPRTRSITPLTVTRRNRTKSSSSHRSPHRQTRLATPFVPANEGPSSVLPRNDDMMDVDTDALMNIVKAPLLDREALETLLPPMVTPSFPVLIALTDRVNTKFLCIWSLAVFIPWEDVVIWVQNLLNATKVLVTRIVRTNRNGSQVFCFKMGSARDAAYLRGLVQGAHTRDAENIQCDFIDGSTYNNVCGKSVDAWTPLDGFKVEQPTTDPVLLNPFQLPKVTLFDRLSSAINAIPSSSSAQGLPLSASTSRTSLLTRLSSTVTSSASTFNVGSTEERPKKKKKRRGTHGRRT